MSRKRAVSWLAAFAFSAAAPAWAQSKETDCKNRVDDDKDSVMDCADADCYADPACKSAGGLENTNELCADWVDNDGDGEVDCDDVDCQTQAITVCRGSWEGPLTGPGTKTNVGDNGGSTGDSGEIPELGEGQSVEDLIGKGSDKDGERNNFVCSDGIDNDNDGKADCADFGCRFDPNVTVCRGTPGLRFSMAAHVRTSYTVTHDTNDTPNPDEEGFGNGDWDTIFNRLQLRAFGPIPFLQDSFFLVSIRAERTPRLTFAMFSVPLGGGHYINVNSGGGGLSNGLILSVSKHILLDPPFYLFNAFEQGNGAAIEANGPLVKGLLDYRVFVAGGSGRFNGNIGGRFFNEEDPNFTWGAGAQVALYALGRFDRWDSRYLYTEVPAALTFYVGGRYDQRAVERFPAVNVNGLFRWWRLIVSLEGYYKRELEFDSNQYSWNLQAGFLIIPKWLFVAADAGQFRATDFQGLPDSIPTDLRRLVDEDQYRAAIHLYIWRNTGLLTFLFTHRFVESAIDNDIQEDLRTSEFRLEAQFRF